MKHPKHKLLRAAYSFYNVATSVPLKQLMEDLLILAKVRGVSPSLDIYIFIYDFLIFFFL